VPEAVYVWLVLAATIWVHALPADALTSMARIMTIALPLFLPLSRLASRRTVLLAASSAAFAVGLMVFAALFGQGWWVQ
jgi:hypothetical protein